jgi:hypothetical protein
MITEVFTDAPIGSPGSPADHWSANNADIVSATLEGDTAEGLFVTQGSLPKTADVLGDDDDPILGLVCKSAHLATPSQIDADGVIQEGVTVGIARTGRHVVFGNGAFSPGAAVYVRYTAVEGEPVGSVSVATDAGKNRLLSAVVARWVTSGEDELGVLDINVNLDADAVDADS